MAKWKYQGKGGQNERKCLKAVDLHETKIFQNLPPNLVLFLPAGIYRAATYLVPQLTAPELSMPQLAACRNLPSAATCRAATCRLPQFAACRNFPCRNLPLPQLSGHRSKHMEQIFYIYDGFRGINQIAGAQVDGVKYETKTKTG